MVEPEKRRRKLITCGDVNIDYIYFMEFHKLPEIDTSSNLNIKMCITQFKTTIL